MFADRHFLSACEPVTRIKQSIGLECKVSLIKKSVFNTRLAVQSFYYGAYFTEALTLGADPVYHKTTSVGFSQFLASMDFIIICYSCQYTIIHISFCKGPVLNLTGLTRIYFKEAQKENSCKSC